MYHVQLPSDGWVLFFGNSRVLLTRLMLRVRCCCMLLGVPLLRLLLRVDPVLLAALLVVALVRVLGPGVSSTVPHRFYAPCDSPLTGGWHPTSLSQGS